MGTLEGKYCEILVPVFEREFDCRAELELHLLLCCCQSVMLVWLAPQYCRGYDLQTLVGTTFLGIG